jgi:hypothetical protein
MALASLVKPLYGINEKKLLQGEAELYLTESWVVI